MEEYKITLMDGREISGILKSEQPKTADKIKLDTTGRYLKIGKRRSQPFTEDQLAMVEQLYNHHLFTEHAWFLLANAEKILSDSRMFLARVKVQSGLAYIGTSGFWRPTLGVYIEWWLNYRQTAIDKNGNLVWYISGSPFSGRNCCSSITPEGKQVKLAQHTSFSSIVRSFMEVNNRYTEAKQRCEAYTLEEVLIMLRGEDYRFNIQALYYEMIQKVTEQKMNDVEKLYNNLRNKMTKLVWENRKLQLRQYREEIIEFYNGYAERQKVVSDLEQVYVKRHRELKKQLHDGTIEGDYHVLLAEASREYRARKREQSDLLNKFILNTFGKNPNGITPSDVIRYANNKPLLEHTLPQI